MFVSAGASQPTTLVSEVGGVWVGKCSRSQHTNRSTDDVHIDAQRLSSDINKLEVELMAKFKEPFFDDDRRDVIMKLPTDSGRQLFKAVQLLATGAKDASDLGEDLINMCTVRKALYDQITMVCNPT